MSRPTPDAILFDFDGTLIDTGELIKVSFRYATLEVLGREIPDEMLTGNVGAPLVQQMEEIAPGRGEELVAVYREFNHAHHDELAAPFPGVEETLAELAGRSVPMAVVTSKGRTAVDLGMRMIALDRFIETIVTADDVEIHKPDPHPLEFAAALLGVDVRRTMYVGDSPHDVASAKAAGAIAAAALWGMFSEDRLLAAGPDVTLTDITQVLDVLDGRLSLRAEEGS